MCNYLKIRNFKELRCRVQGGWGEKGKGGLEASWKCWVLYEHKQHMLVPSEPQSGRGGGVGGGEWGLGRAFTAQFTWLIPWLGSETQSSTNAWIKLTLYEHHSQTWICLFIIYLFWGLSLPIQVPFRRKKLKRSDWYDIYEDFPQTFIFFRHIPQHLTNSPYYPYRLSLSLSWGNGWRYYWKPIWHEFITHPPNDHIYVPHLST